MIKKYFIILIALICAFNVNAKKIKGQILRQNDTIQVVFSIPVIKYMGNPDYENLQDKVKYYDASGKKVFLKPEDALEYRFTLGTEEIRMISHNHSPELADFYGTKIFLKLEIDGELKLLSYYYTRHSGGSQGFPIKVKQKTLQKGCCDLKCLNVFSFKKDMVEYFKDCPELIKEIENKDLTMSNIKEIISFYNTNCK